MPNHAKTRLLRHHLCLLFDKAQLRQVTVVLLVLPFCLPILYAPLTKAKTFRNTAVAPSGGFRPDDVIGYLNASRLARCMGLRRAAAAPSWAWCLGAIPGDCIFFRRRRYYQSQIAGRGAGDSWGRMAQGLLSLHERHSTFGMASSNIVYSRKQSAKVKEVV